MTNQKAITAGFRDGGVKFTGKNIL